MTLVETLYSDGARDIHDPLGNLKEMSAYPDLSHWMVVYVAKFLAINPLAALQLWVGVLCITAALLVALKLDQCVSTLGLTSAVLPRVLMLGWLGVATGLGLSLPGHITFNFFFAQLFGTVIAVAAYLWITRVKMPEPVLYCIIICFGGIVLPNAHLVPSVWFVLASVIYVAGTRETWRGRATGVGSFLLPVGLCWYSNPAVMQMIRIAGATGGDFVLRTGVIRSVASVGVVSLLGAVLVIWVLLRVRRMQSVRIVDVISSQSGLIAVVALMLVQTLIVVVGGRGDAYGVAKYLYIFCLEFPSGICLACAVLGLGAGQNRGVRWQNAVSWASLALFFTFQAPFPRFPYDQSNLIEISNALRENRKVMKLEGRRYPQFGVLTSAMNYYLAIGILRIPRDAQTMRWFVEAHGTGESPLPPNWLAQAGSTYAYQLSLDKGAVEDALKTGRDILVHVKIPNASKFRLANRLPTKAGEVVLGYRWVDKKGETLVEGRSILRNEDGSPEEFVANIPGKKPSENTSALRVGVVQEGIDWFNTKQGRALEEVRLR